MLKPTLIGPISPQIVNELGTFGPFDLKQFIASDEESGPLTFSAELASGSALPQGMICTADGILTGIPAKNTQGIYEILVTAENAVGPLVVSVTLTIKPNMSGDAPDYFDKLKAQVWEALEQKMPVPDLSEFYDRPISPAEIYYLIERFGFIKIWDVYNLDTPTDKVLLELDGASAHYDIYDKGSCLVATPKDLFSYERTLEDGLQTARAMAKEAYQRGWTVEFVGFYKLTRAAWVEFQRLNLVNNTALDVINYDATPDEAKLVEESLVRSQRPVIE